MRYPKRSDNCVSQGTQEWRDVQIDISIELFCGCWTRKRSYSHLLLFSLSPWSVVTASVRVWNLFLKSKELLYLQGTFASLLRNLCFSLTLSLFWVRIEGIIDQSCLLTLEHVSVFLVKETESETCYLSLLLSRSNKRCEWLVFVLTAVSFQDVHLCHNLISQVNQEKVKSRE